MALRVPAPCRWQTQGSQQSAISESHLETRRGLQTVKGGRGFVLSGRSQRWLESLSAGGLGWRGADAGAGTVRGCWTLAFSRGQSEDDLSGGVQTRALKRQHSEEAQD